MFFYVYISISMFFLHRDSLSFYDLEMNLQVFSIFEF